MNESNHQPSFLDNKPIGQDLLEGQSHEKTAQILYNVIAGKRLPGNVIGLEGNWGSGKSNVIDILKRKFDESNNEYVFFTYDTWGHQEDLTRRTFLEEIINELLDGNDSNDRLKRNTDWQTELNKLTAKVSRKSIEKIPRLRFFLVPLFLGILSFSLLKVVYTDFFKGVDLWSNQDFTILKPIVFKYLVPVGFFIWGIRELIKEYSLLKKEDEQGSFNQNNWRGRLSRLFYWFNGKGVESSELENVVEEEPSVKQFKEFLQKITGDLKVDGLVVIFDNMDRLSSNEKLLSLWSSIHTFFAESPNNNDDKITVIIPYDRVHLEAFFESVVFEQKGGRATSQSFINKTFSTVFRVPPPVLSDWKAFFELKFDESFGMVGLKDDIRVVSTLFELKTNSNSRSPRDIISFINRLVALSLRHSELSVVYLAVFVLEESAILNEPQKVISTKGLFSSQKHLIPDWEELEQSLAAIVYGVDKEKANEVLLSNSIDDILNKENHELLKSIKEHSQFERYFNQRVQSINLVSRNFKIIPQVFAEISDRISPGMQKMNWQKLAMDIEGQSSSEFTEFLDWQKPYLTEAPSDLALDFGQKILRTLSENLKFPEGDRERCSDYYQELYKLLKFCKEKNLNFVTQLLPHEVRFTGENFLIYVDVMLSPLMKAKVPFEQMNIHASSSDVCDYLIGHQDGFTIGAFSFKHVIKFLLSQGDYDLSELEISLKAEIDKISYSQPDTVGQLISLNEVICHDKRILFPPDMANSYLDRIDIDDEHFPVFVMNQVAQLNKLSSKGANLIQVLDSEKNLETYLSDIQYFISYGDLIKLAVNPEHDHKFILAVVVELTKDPQGVKQRLHVEWVFKNLHGIETTVFFEGYESFKNFLARFDRWSNVFAEALTSDNVMSLPLEIQKLALREIYQVEPYQSINHILSKTIEYFRGLDQQEWLANIGYGTHSEQVFEEYVMKGRMDNKITKSKPFMSSYQEFMVGVAKKEHDLPEGDGVWGRLLDNEMLDKRRLSTIFNDCLENLLSHAEIGVDRIQFFIKPIVYHAKTESHADDIIRKMIIPTKSDSTVFNDLVDELHSELINLINVSNRENDQVLFDVLDGGLENSSGSKLNIKIENILSSTGLIRLRPVASDNDSVSTENKD